MLFHSTHLHWHIDGSSQYALFDRQGQRVAIARKVSFCLRDSQRVPGATRSRRGRRTPSALATAGKASHQAGATSMTRTSTVRRCRSGPGSSAPSASKMTADPFDFFREADESNNASLTPLRIRGTNVTIGGPGCRDS